jgi:hypothetical protein
MNDLTPEECRRIRDEWRRHAPRIVELWAHVENVTHVTTVPREMADTNLTGGQYRTPERLEGLHMFRTDFTDYVVFAVLVFALVAAVFQ